tara:strand:- start:1607 stop:1765 length:159 start_codon:yes stop_codon:yes gene_type:complete
MNCWHCKAELIWGGDHDVDDSEEFVMETNLTCPECNTFYLVYLPIPEEDKHE